MATPKSLRTPPPRMIADYVVSIRNLNGNNPVSIPDSEFPESNFGGSGDSSASVAERTISRPIGFTVNIDNTSYKEFYHYRSGWMFLKDPARSYSIFGSAPWLDLVTLFTTANETIKTSFTYNHLLLAPWFDQGSPVGKYIQNITSSYSALTADVIEKVEQGADTRIWPYDHYDNSVRFVNSYDADKGKSLLVRWTNTQVNYGYRFKFEVALFENGAMEYRYWPTLVYEQSDTPPTESSATVAVFSGALIGGNKFRDLSPLLDYKKNQRILSELGGTKYDFGFMENSKPYANSIRRSNWPKGGAVITLTPPNNLVKFLPRVVSKEKSNIKTLSKPAGLFDDRKTMVFEEPKFSIFLGKYIPPYVPVHMPSTLPSRLLGDTGDTNVSIRQLLFAPPEKGIKISSGSLRKNVVEDALEQLEIYEGNDHSVDLSFNEGQKNYNSIVNESEFYKTGSSMDVFGPGFDGPLKSKTQIKLSLPVSRPTTLPPFTASFNYYDKGLNRWILVDPDGYRRPENSVVLEGVGSLSGYVEHDTLYFNRVTETSRGFDAIGRKIVSGSSNIDFTIGAGARSYQTDEVIGLTYNKKNVVFQQALSKQYEKSITDNSVFFPANSQQIDPKIEEPFLVEKIVATVPLYAEGDWFNDKTTCIRAFGDVGPAEAMASGTMDFGGPALTFAVFCPKKAPGVQYFDLIASGTITHQFDDKAEVYLGKESGMNYHSLRPIGFRSFSNPTTVISGTLDGATYKYNDNAKLELTPSIASGVSYLRNDRRLNNESLNYVTINRARASQLLTSPNLTNFENLYNNYDYFTGTLGFVNYINSSPRIHVQNVSPLSRGTTKFEFNGNSILGGTIASFNNETTVKNPLFVGTSLPASYITEINSANFRFDAVMQYSTVDSRPSPYLLMPGDKLTLAISKTRPVIYKMELENTTPVNGLGWVGSSNSYKHTQLTGSHNTIVLNSGSIELTLYGSYVREGRGYNP